MEYSKEFKAALSAFSSQEKDKLIFRLLRKDKLLSKKLYFELIDPENTDDKRNAMEEQVEEKNSFGFKIHWKCQVLPDHYPENKC